MVGTKRAKWEGQYLQASEDRDLEARRMGIGKFIGSNLVIFCNKKFDKFALCKSVSQSEATFIVYSESIESGHVKINFL